MVAEELNVFRQTISNCENEKSYPNIISVIQLSSLYSISLDDLLKGDEKVMKHLEESTNVIKSNQKLIGVILINIVLVAVVIILSIFLPNNQIYHLGIFCLIAISSSALLYQIIQKNLRRTILYGMEYNYFCCVWRYRSCGSYFLSVSAS